MYRRFGLLPIRRRFVSFDTCTIDVLRQAGRNTAPLTESFPDFDRESAGLSFEQQMEFVDIEPCRFMLRTVDRNAIPNGVLHDQQSHFFESLAERFQLEADNAVVIQIHV